MWRGCWRTQWQRTHNALITINQGMVHDKKPRGYWTKDAVFAEGKKYKNRRNWQLAQSRSYNIAWENGWLDEIMGREIIHGTWTKEAVLASGKKYLTKTAWRNSEEGSAYVIAKRNGWLTELRHFEREFSFGERTIYKWLLSRNIQFESEKTFIKLRHKYPLRFDFWIPTHNLLIEYQGRQHALGWSGDKADALEIQMRDRLKREYAIENGFNLVLIEAESEKAICGELEKHLGTIAPRELEAAELARIKTLGGWTKERALLEAKKFQTRKEWENASHGYDYARINGFVDEACAHMVRANAWTKARKKVWSKEAVIADARKYSRPIEWKRSSPSAYAIGLRSGWHLEATAHMEKRSRANPTTDFSR